MPSANSLFRQTRPKRRRLSLRWRLAICALISVLAAVVVDGLVRGLRPTTGGPHGQVVAVVNGREITLQDLDAEARARGFKNYRGAGPALLGAVTDRVLLAGTAKSHRLDQTDIYISDKVRADDQVLANQLVNAAAAATDAELQAYIQAHPLAFMERERLHLRQVVFSAEPKQAAAFDALPTLAAVRGQLDAARLPYRDLEVIVDSSQLPERIASALDSLDAGSVLITRQGDDIIASEVMSKEPAPLAPAAQIEQARNLLQQERDAFLLKARLAELRRNATISYQTGFSPSSASPAPRR